MQAMELRCEIRYLKSERKIEAVPLTSVVLETDMDFASRCAAPRLRGRTLHGPTFISDSKPPHHCNPPHVLRKHSQMILDKHSLAGYRPDRLG